MKGDMLESLSKVWCWMIRFIHQDGKPSSTHFYLPVTFGFAYETQNDYGIIRRRYNYGSISRSREPNRYSNRRCSRRYNIYDNIWQYTTFMTTTDTTTDMTTAIEQIGCNLQCLLHRKGFLKSFYDLRFWKTILKGVFVY